MYHLRALLIALFSLGISACQTSTSADPDTAQQADANQEDGAARLSLSFEKYQLANGLTVILHEDHSDPIVHVDVTYHVGSAREEAGKSGFAHFFEHMMFQGSKHVADDAHIGLLQAVGGSVNGSTNRDRTNYYQTVPANQLETTLWLESDRMGFLLEAVDQTKFEVQRETVKNERGQRVDNRPYGRVFERVAQALYPTGHPYSWSTIGYIEDLNRVGVSDLKAFFLRWYGPNNATLTIGGDIDPAQTKRLIEKYFGPIPAGPAVERAAKSLISFDETRYTSMTDKVTQPLLRIAYPTVYARHPDEAALDVLRHILGIGKNALLYQSFVKNSQATYANASHGCGELGCSFEISVLLNPQQEITLQQTHQRVLEILDEFEQSEVDPAAIDSVVNEIKSGLIYSLESVAAKTSRLAHDEIFSDNPNESANDIARYQQVSAEDVKRVYRTYIKNRGSVVLSVLPEGGAYQPVAADNWQLSRPELAEYQPVKDADLAYRIVEETFDRSRAPVATGNIEPRLPDSWQTTLPGDIPATGTQLSEAPITVVTLQFEAGQAYEGKDEIGLSSLTAAMLNEATQHSSSEALSQRLEKIGAQVSFSSDNRYAYLNLRSLTEHLDEAISVAAERLFSPAFSDPDFDRLQQARLQNIHAADKVARTVAQNTFQRLLYGDSSFAYSSAGTVESVAAMAVADARSFYQSTYTREGAQLFIASDLQQSSILARLSPLLKPLTQMGNSDRRRRAQAHLPQVAEGTLYFVDRPGAAQSHIIVGRRAMPYDGTGQFYRAGIANHPFGGLFASRLNLNLREDKGVTYGARSSFTGDGQLAHFSAAAAIRSDATRLALDETLSELDAYAKTGMTIDELTTTQNSLAQGRARRYETSGQKLAAIQRRQNFALPADYLQQQAQILQQITPAELNQLAAEYMDPAQMIVVVVGDKESVWPTLDGLPLTLKALTATP